MSGASLKSDIDLPRSHQIGANKPPGRPRTDWPERRLQTLRALFDQGLSHELIAQRMWTTKGSISAKIDRLGWTRLATVVSLRPDRSAMAAKAKERRAQAAMAKAIEESVVGVGLLQLEPHMCRWPLAYTSEQTFCAAERMGRSSYCGEHDARSRVRTGVLPTGLPSQRIVAG